jgi:hypothetical protein
MSLSQAFGSSNPFQAPQYGEVQANNAGLVPVANTAITADSIIVLTVRTATGAQAGQANVVSKTPGTGFSIASGAADTSFYKYCILKY